jgi:hypothetical protein
MATVKDLRICAKGLGLKGFSTMNKGELEELINKTGVAVKTETMEVKVNATPAPAKTTKEQEPAAAAMDKIRKERTKSTWNNFLTDYRVANNCSLKNAMAAKEAYTEYKSKASMPSKVSDPAPEQK